MSDLSNITNKPDPSGVTSPQATTPMITPPSTTSSDLGADVLSSVAKQTPHVSNQYAAHAPKLAEPSVKITATTDPNLLTDGNFATLIPSDFTSSILTSFAKTQDPTTLAGTDIVVNGQSIFASAAENVGTIITSTPSTTTKNMLKQLASDPSSPLYGTDIPDDDVNGNPIDYSGLKDIVYMLALLLGQLPTMQTKCTNELLNNLNGMVNAISNSVKETIAQQAQATEQAEAAQEAAQKTSKWSDIFGWITSGLAIIAGIALVATGVGTAAGVGLIIGGGLMLANQIFQDSGLYQKSPKFAAVMSYFMPIAQAVVAIGITIATGGVGFLAGASLALTLLSSATTVTDNILTETGEISENSDTDQALQYTAMGLSILGSLLGVGDTLKGGGATTEEKVQTSFQKGMKFFGGVVQTTESATSAVKSGLDIATGVTELKVAELEYQITLFKTSVTKYNTASDVDQQFIQTLMTALQQYVSMIPNLSKSLNSLISSQGDAATAALK